MQFVGRKAAARFAPVAKHRLKRNVLVSMPAVLILALINGYPVNPGGEPRLEPEAGQSAIDFQEHDLEDVLGCGGVAERVVNQIVNSFLIFLVDRFECSAIAGLDSPNQ